MSYDEHKEARLELADLHREWRIECDLRQTAQQIATDATRRAEAAEAELRGRELRHFETEQENAHLQAQVAAVRALAENARKHAGGPYTAQVDALSIERALSSSEPVTAGPDVAKDLDEREWCLICGHLLEHHDEDGCFRGDPGAGWDCSCEAIDPESLTWDPPAGEVTPPAEQGLSGLAEAFLLPRQARPTTEGGQP